jgi:hypothetical protein
MSIRGSPIGTVPSVCEDAMDVPTGPAPTRSRFRSSSGTPESNVTGPGGGILRSTLA